MDTWRFRHGDYATARATLAKIAGAPPDLVGRAHFLEGEMAYAEFRSVGTKDDLAATIDANVKALAAVTKAFKPVIEGGEIRWAMAGLARVADANMKFAAFLRGLQLPANLPAADAANVKAALGAQADEAQKRGADMRASCVKEAKKHELFSQGARSCLLDESLPDAIPMYPTVASKGGSEPATAAPLHKALLKNPKDVGALLKLTEIHLAMGDAGVALLLAERAAQAAPRSAEAKNLHALALHAVNEPQDAGDTFKEAVALEPNEPHWHLNLAAHYAVFGHLDRARAELQKAGTPPSAPRGPIRSPGRRGTHAPRRRRQGRKGEVKAVMNVIRSPWPRLAVGFVVFFVLAPAVACGGGVVSISPSEFDRLPRESRQETFDAENDLVIAKNREDDAEDHKQAARAASTRLDERWTRMSKRLAASNQQAKVPLARKVFDAQGAYLQAEIAVASAEIEQARVETDLSRARLVLVRQRQLARIGRVTAGSLDPLEKSVTAYEASFKQASTATNAERTRAEQQLEAWKAAEDDYARTSGGDFDTVVWAE